MLWSSELRAAISTVNLKQSISSLFLLNKAWIQIELQSNGASQRTNLLQLSKLGGRIFNVHSPWTLISPLFGRQFYVAEKVVHFPLRGLTTDGEDVPPSRRRTAIQKNVHFELMLGQIANVCSVISRNTIVKISTSVNSIWQAIRAHYGFQSTGSHFFKLSSIRLEVDERLDNFIPPVSVFYQR